MFVAECSRAPGYTRASVSLLQFFAASAMLCLVGSCGVFPTQWRSNDVVSCRVLVGGLRTRALHDIVSPELLALDRQHALALAHATSMRVCKCMRMCHTVVLCVGVHMNMYVCLCLMHDQCN